MIEVNREVHVLAGALYSAPDNCVPSKMHFPGNRKIISGAVAVKENEVETVRKLYVHCRRQPPQQSSSPWHRRFMTTLAIKDSYIDL